MNNQLTLGVALLVCVLTGLCCGNELRIRNVCRVKGQEANVLEGRGIVVGLSGTGDTDKYTLRILASLLMQSGEVIGRDDKGNLDLNELKSAKNAALVHVTATVPAEGAREGDWIDCRVSANSAKSLRGGQLLATTLHNIDPRDTNVYAVATGAVSVDDENTSTVGHVSAGCQIKTDFRNRFFLEDKINLVLHRTHAGFAFAQEVEYVINDQPDFRDEISSTGVGIAKALDSKTIEVRIPRKYQDSKVQFVSDILNVRMISPPKKARVTIHRASGAIVVGENVKVLPTVITHRNLVITTGDRTVSEFVRLSPESSSVTTKLDALVEAMRALKVAPDDMIDIIESLHENGDLYGELIIK